MKENEVMIGDWVSCGGHYRKIQSLEFDNTEEEKCWFWSDEDQALCLLSEHDPIPLTPEILEKNGFIVKHTESAKRTYWKDRAGQIVGHKNRGLMYMEISGNPVKFGYFLPHFSGHIQFVHELQHALRLCGISKEIVL